MAGQGFVIHRPDFQWSFQCFSRATSGETRLHPELSAGRTRWTPKHLFLKVD